MNIRERFAVYRKKIGPAMLLVGFVIDNLTLTRIDRTFDNLVLASYLLLAIVCTTALSYLDYRRKRTGVEVHPRLRLSAMLLLQFAFGGLFSGYFVFYSRSGTLAGSWIFLGILLVLLVGNDSFRAWYERFSFRMTVLFLALFSFAIFYLPIVLGRMGALVFVLSGLVSVAVMELLNRSLARFVDTVRVRRVRWGTAAVFVFMNVLYFTNTIPPIPLSVKAMGVYHNIVKTADGYRALDEKVPWYRLPARWWRLTYTLDDSGNAYFFSAVFSPTRLNATIVHRWQYYDTSNGEWTEQYRFTYDIVGGRSGGFRFYSLKEHIIPGRWRVDVETPRGQLLGRFTFTVLPSDKSGVSYQEVAL